MALPDDVRAACARVAARARQVRVDDLGVERLARALRDAPDPPRAELDPTAHVLTGDREQRAGFHLALDAINFGSGWFPTLRKREGRSGYFTVALGLKDAWPLTADELAAITPQQTARMLGQAEDHELMALHAQALNDLGTWVRDEHGGRFASVVDAAGGSAVALAELLAQRPAFHDVSTYDGDPVPFFKRAQIAASDLALAGVHDPPDLHELTIFADNLVPHVLKLEGVLRVDPALDARIEAGELLIHGEPAEVELRACAVDAVERVVQAHGATTAAHLDQVLWTRGQLPQSKARPRHRARTTAY